MKDTERHNYIGDHIRKLREEKGWTQQVLGKKLGKKTSTISAYETNAKLPSVDPFCGPFDFSCPGLAAVAVCFTRVL